MWKKYQPYVLGALLVMLLLAVYLNRSEAPGIPNVVAANKNFEPLKVEDPQLRLDLLQAIRDTEYTGGRHNIFSYAPEPAPAATKRGSDPRPFIPKGPQPEPPPPPLSIPVTFFGFAVNEQTHNRLAFLNSGEDVLIVGEGGTLWNRFRLLKIDKGSAEFEEISSGRRASVPITKPEQQP